MTKSSTNSTQSTSLWGPQNAALTTVMNDANSTYNGIKSNNSPLPSEFTAGMTPDQLSVFSQMLGTGQGLLSGANTGAAAGTGMTTAGASGATGALGALTGYDPTRTNNMAANIQGGLDYASKMNIPGAVANAMQPALEMARDTTLPGITAGAAGTGNINSNRPDLASGIVQRGLAEQATGLGASMFNDAFNTGANLTSNTNQTNNAGILSAITSALGGGTNLATAGSSVTGSGADNLGALFNMMTTGAAGPQQNQQLSDTNALQKYQGDTSLPYNALSGLLSLVGTNNWAPTTTTNSTSTPSAMQTIAGLMSGVGGLLGSSGGVLGGGSGLLGMSPTLFGLLPKR